MMIDGSTNVCSGQLYFLAALLRQARQGALVPEAVRALMSDEGQRLSALTEIGTSCKMAPMILERAYPVWKSNSQTDIYLDSKRKASDQLGSESPSKRVKNSHSETITPEADGKPRVVPFPEKVCRLGSTLGTTKV